MSEVEALTPWLATRDGLDALGAALGLRLKSAESEFAIGSDWRADMRCVTAEPQPQVVIVEAQLGHADQRHLGKVMLYACNAQCDIAVWVAEAFRPEQLRTFEALNASRDGTPTFVAVSVHAVPVPEQGVGLLLRCETAVPPQKDRTTSAQPNATVKHAPADDEGAAQGQVAYRHFWPALVEVARPELPCPHGLWNAWRGWASGVATVQFVVAPGPETLRIGLVGPRTQPCVGRHLLTDAEVVDALNARLPPELCVRDMRPSKPCMVHVGLEWPWPEGVVTAADLHALAHRAADAAAALRHALAAVATDARSDS